MRGNEIELAWAAGFIDGEGCIRFRTCKSKAYRSRDYGSLSVSAAQVHREPLDRLEAAVGGGAVYGPYGPYKTTRQPHYQYHATGKAAVEVFSLLRPYLSSIKRSDGDAALAALAEQKARPKLGNGFARRRELQDQRLAHE